VKLGFKYAGKKMAVDSVGVQGAVRVGGSFIKGEGSSRILEKIT